MSEIPQDTVAEIQCRHLRYWDIEAELVPRSEFRGKEEEVAIIHYDLAFRRARIQVTKDYELYSVASLREIIAHELGHLCTALLDLLPQATLDELKNVDEELANRFAILLLGRKLDI